MKIGSFFNSWFRGKLLTIIILPEKIGKVYSYRSKIIISKNLLDIKRNEENKLGDFFTLLEKNNLLRSFFIRNFES
jgi:hypothetical protein